jgi:hypothetical protein
MLVVSGAINAAVQISNECRHKMHKDDEAIEILLVA